MIYVIRAIKLHSKNVTIDFSTVESKTMMRRGRNI